MTTTGEVSVHATQAGVLAPVSRELCLLCAAGTGAVVSLVEASVVVDAHRERTSEFTLFAPFGGWQVDAVEIAAAVAAVVLLVLSLAVAARLFRRLRERTPYRRVAVLAALLPGLALGVFAGLGTRAAIDAASNHTAAASRMRFQAAAAAAAYRRHPLVMRPFGAHSAPAASAESMLHVSDLGAGWYDGIQPNQAESTLSISSPLRQLGVSTAVRATVMQAHKVGDAWSLGTMALETLYTFPTASEAARYMREERMETSEKCPCPPRQRWSSSLLDGATVWQRVGPTGDPQAMFTVRRRVFVVVMTRSNQESPRSDLVSKVIGAAVRRATAT